MAITYMVRRSLIEITWPKIDKNLVRTSSNKVLSEEDRYFDVKEEAETEMHRK